MNNSNINASPMTERQLISQDYLSKIYNELGLICGSEGVQSYDNLVKLLERIAENNFSDYLNKVRACSRSIFIRNILSSEQLKILASRYGIKAPVSFSSPVMHVSSAKLMPGVGDLAPHQDWPSCLGSLNSIIVWISLGGATSESGGLDFYCSDQHLPLLSGSVGDHVVGANPKELALLQKKYYYVDPGDAIVFGNFLPHGSQNGKTRISVSLRIEDASEDFWRSRGYEYAQKIQIDRKNFTIDEMLNINAIIKKN